jgi:diguanylate cyclase (GGDEF)-like protein/PAS domain S-box-containing protein
MSRAHGVSLTAVVIGGAMAFFGAAWAGMDRPAAFAVLMIAAVLDGAYAPTWPRAEEDGRLMPSFAIAFAALLLFDATHATVVVVLGILSGSVAAGKASWPVRHAVLRGLVPLAAIQLAAVTYGAVGAATGALTWPSRSLPIAAAVGAYCLVKVVMAPTMLRWVSKQPFDRACFARMAGEWPGYFAAAGASVVVAELLAAARWELLPVAAVPLFVVYGGYCRHLTRIEEDCRRQHALQAADVAACILAADGRVICWNDRLLTLLGRSGDAPLDPSLLTNGPWSTKLQQTLRQVAIDGTPRTLSSVALPATLGGRTVDFSLVGRSDGVMLLWEDATDRAHAARLHDRLALAVAGAHDVVWEWDLRTQELYLSPRWKTVIGADAAEVCGPEEWLNRVHPDDVAALRTTLTSADHKKPEPFACEHRVRHADGSYLWLLCRGVAAGSGRKPSRLAGSLTDVTERVAAAERLKTAGFVDALTGLRNRSDFEAAVERRIQRFHEHPADGRFAILYLDLDRFKIVNDSLGHLVGDELLVAVARRLESCLREGDVLARLGGDEFAILMTNITDGGEANSLALRIRSSLGAPVPIAGRDVFTSASIGIAVGHAEYASPDEIVRDADAAMYHAKRLGRSRHELFDADMHTRARDRLGMENDLRRAVSENDFELHYQPIVLLGTRMCVGFESLVRWRRNGEMVSPGVFIPIAEELGLMDELGTWILHQACRTFADWRQRFPHAGLDYITVNASGRQLTHRSFVVEVEKAVRTSRLPPSAVRIEITETALMDNPTHAVEVLTQLREFGVKIYLDDFGTGYSSLSHLHRLPVDALKIDQSFVKSMLVPDRPAIVESILALARTMKTSVVAEGIEDERQAEELLRFGCTHAQGYLFSRPLPVRAAEALIAAGQPLGLADQGWTESSSVVPFKAAAR